MAENCVWPKGKVFDLDLVSYEGESELEWSSFWKMHVRRMQRCMSKEEKWREEVREWVVAGEEETERVCVIFEWILWQVYDISG